MREEWKEGGREKERERSLVRRIKVYRNVCEREREREREIK